MKCPEKEITNFYVLMGKFLRQRKEHLKSFKGPPEYSGFHENLFCQLIANLAEVV